MVLWFFSREGIGWKFWKRVGRRMILEKSDWVRVSGGARRHMVLEERGWMLGSGRKGRCMIVEEGIDA